ncbi:MAG: short-chain dehydrogenase/reductase [Acidimicrobiales bacterium]|nr:short-chain dehydrogenase/reductase [Acidimicrobiales bacterium]
MGTLGGRTAIVAGGGQGIGRGVALALASAGADVVVADLKEHKAKAVADEVAERGAGSLGVACDVRDVDQIAATVAATVERFGGIDILVNAAIAPFQVQPLEDCTVEVMQDMLHSGLIGVTAFMQVAFPHLRDSGHGRIINFGSSAGINGSAGYGVYAPVKEGVRAITRVASREWGKHGITANAICPYANSPSWAKWSDDNPGMADLAVSHTSMGRIGDCEHDVGAAAVFLASDAAAYTTGHTLMVDGGQSHL